MLRRKGVGKRENSERFVTITGGGSERVLIEGMWGGRRVVKRRVVDAAWGLEWGEGRLFGNASGTGRSSCGNA